MTGADPCKTIWASLPGEMSGAVVSVTMAASLSLSNDPTILPSCTVNVMADAKRSGVIERVLSAMARVTGAESAGVTNDFIASSTAAWVTLGAVTVVLAGTLVVFNHPWVIAATVSGTTTSRPSLAWVTLAAPASIAMAPSTGAEATVCALSLTTLVRAASSTVRATARSLLPVRWAQMSAGLSENSPRPASEPGMSSASPAVVGSTVKLLSESGTVTVMGAVAFGPSSAISFAAAWSTLSPPICTPSTAIDDGTSRLVHHANPT